MILYMIDPYITADTASRPRRVSQSRLVRLVFESVGKAVTPHLETIAGRARP